MLISVLILVKYLDVSIVIEKKPNAFRLYSPSLSLNFVVPKQLSKIIEDITGVYQHEWYGKIIKIEMFSSGFVI